MTLICRGKVDVNGPKTATVFRVLKAARPGTIRWNFAGKFLVDKFGTVTKRARLSPRQFEDDIVELLQQPYPGS